MTTTAVETPDATLLHLLERGEDHAFVDGATRLLERRPSDLYLRLMTIRTLLSLGLVEPAQELAEADDASPEIQQIAARVAQLPRSEIPWVASIDTFEANLAILEQRGVSIQRIRDAWRAGEKDFQRFVDLRGQTQIRRRHADGGWRWSPRLADHARLAEAQPLPDALKTLMPMPVLFDGVELGHLLTRVYNTTHNTFLDYSCALFVVEPDAVAFAVALHLQDWTRVLSDERVRLDVGPDTLDRLATAWDDDLDLAVPSVAFHLGGLRDGESASVLDVVETAGKRREQRIADSQAELERRYAGRDLQYWAKRFDEALSGRGEPLRIVSAVSTHTTFLQHSMRDARAALEALGHRVEVLTERRCFDVISPLRYHDAIRNLDADLFLAVDHLRHEFAGLLPTNLPVLTWDQDLLPQVFTPENMRRVPPLDFVTGCAKGAWVRAGCDPGQCLHARVPTNPDTFDGPPLTHEERERFSCDVSFVSHASQTPWEFHQQERAQYADAGLRRFLDALHDGMAGLMARYRVPAEWALNELIDETCSAAGVALRDDSLRSRLVNWYLWRLGDRMFRHEALEWVAHWAKQRGRSLRLFGKGWDRHPTLAAFAAGPVENGRELLCVHRASKINLQLMPAGFLHQRALDGMCGGGFFLARLAPQDLRGDLLRQIMRRLNEAGVTHNDGLRALRDENLERLLDEYTSGSYRRRIARGDDVFNELVVAAELEYPDELFPGFRDIVFDSADEFAAAADRFLAADDARRETASRMRDVVIERFSYRRTMDGFLRAMGAHLKEIAG